MISAAPNPVNWIEVKESYRVPRLELDERIQTMNCVSEPYLNALGGWNWVWNLVRTHLLSKFNGFSHFHLLRWAKRADCWLKSTKGSGTEMQTQPLGLSVRLNARIISKPLGYWGLIINNEHSIKIILSALKMGRGNENRKDCIK